MPKVVLVVDDSDSVRGVCKAFLGREHDVLEARDGVEALRLCQSVKVDVLLTDVVMPGMSGVELGKRVANLKLGIRIIYMSGFIPSDDPVPRDAPFLMKPFTPVDLLTTVKKEMEANANHIEGSADQQPGPPGEKNPIRQRASHDQFGGIRCDGKR